MIVFWLIIISAALASFFFTAANFALFDYSRSKLDEVLEARGRAAWMDRLDARRDELLLTSSLLRTVMNLIILVAMLWLFRSPDPQRWWTETLLALFAAGMVVSIFGVAIPISWARHSAEPFLAYTLPLLLGVAAVMRPIMVLLHLFDPLVRRLLGVPKPTDQDTTPVEQEILDAVSEGEKSGLVDEDQKQMIEAVVAFPATTVDQIMTPRTDIEGIPASASLDEVKGFITQAGHSRVPVYDGDLDHIAGILYAKDLIPLLGRADSGEGFDLRKVARPAIFVPETKTLRDLLTQLREMKVHIAIVLDEYGGTAGLVTVEDIVEEIFGEIRDEYEPPDEQPPQVQKIDDHTWEAHGRVYIGEVNSELDIELPDEEDYDTLGGFILATLGRIPDTGEAFERQGLRFTVLEAERTRVNRVKIELLDRDEAPIAESQE